VRALTPCVEDRGIDEIYIDLTEVPGAQADAGAAVAQSLKDAVHAATGLSCSIGVAPNKLLAKICSDLDKPNGLTLLAAADVPSRIWPLPARKVNGIGPKATARLEGFGIRTIGELAAADAAWLIAEFGSSYGAWLHRAAHGDDERPVVTFSEPKSISRETTFERDLHAVRDRAALTAILDRLCLQLAADLERKGYVGQTMGIKLRFDDFQIVTRDLTLDAATMDARRIRQAVSQCLKRVDLTRRLRLLGVRAGKLATAANAASPLTAHEPEAPYSLPLFDR